MITDYYMGFAIDEGLPMGYKCRGKWDERLMALKPNQYFDVELDDDRLYVLRRAKMMGIKVLTMKLQNGGYRIWRAADNTPRKRGQPRIWGNKHE